MATGKHVWGFFYGSYLNFDVLKEVNIRPSEWCKACLPGFRIFFNPRANLMKSEIDCVFGINAKMTHAELSRLYQHANDILGQEYLPEAVLTQTEKGIWSPALCYISPNQRSQNPEDAYVDRIVKPCTEYGFPDWYIKKLESIK